MQAVVNDCERLVVVGSAAGVVVHERAQNVAGVETTRVSQWHVVTLLVVVVVVDKERAIFRHVRRAELVKANPVLVDCDRNRCAV